MLLLIIADQIINDFYVVLSNNNCCLFSAFNIPDNFVWNMYNLAWNILEKTQAGLNDNETRAPGSADLPNPCIYEPHK